ncbi:MAG: translation elongation factor 4 [Candidatus Pacebacteria bacterium]|nr:translation elongation factor 4 [Candidatus Paceibacterota bacterium]
MKKIRNFLITSHIDHGKSTLSDRLLEITQTVPLSKMKEQFLDAMELERGKGITIKMHPVRMDYKTENEEYILNLIDTPGHVDFSYEVSRSLAAVEGAILLVDATKGIQAQTISNLEMAKKQNLVIIPAVNKIDSPQARVEETKEDMAKLLGISKEEILPISAKTGQNLKELLDLVITKIPAPQGDKEKPFRALIFDSKFDSFKGIIAYVRIMEGSISANEKIHLLQAKEEGEVKDLGYFKPQLISAPKLEAGEIGYIATGIKEPGKVRVGDTIAKESNVSPFGGYKEPKPVVFASVYPENSDDFENLKVALAKLKLNDASFTFEPETQESLGRGFRCGFLGTLHAEIISERLKREFDLGLVISIPSVVFRIFDQKGKELSVYSPSEWPSPSEIKEIQEPWVRMEIITPMPYFGRISDLLKAVGGKSVEVKYFGSGNMIIIQEVPLKAIITGFYDNLKGVSQGMASMDYEILGYRPAELVKMEVLIAGKKEEALSKIVYKETAFLEGKKMVEKLKEVLPSQMFAVSLQAVVGGKVVARETISAKRRDVIAPLYGGDYTRKKKLLEQQKKGKKELKDKGKMHIPPNVFLDMFRS